MQILPKDTSIVSVAESVQGNPNLMYSAFLMMECHEYMAMMRESSDKVKNVDAGTGALIAMYPDRAVKKKLMELYLEEKQKDGGAVNASIITISEMMSCLSDVMEWTQKSYMGF